MSILYNADIIEAAARDGSFMATLREPPITATGTADPEHAICFAMVAADLPDGEIQFWRGTTPTLLFRSVHRAAGYRIGLGADFPYRLARREEAPAVFARDRVRGVAQNRETLSGGTSGRPTLAAFPENPRTVCEAAE